MRPSRKLPNLKNGAPNSARVTVPLVGGRRAVLGEVPDAVAVEALQDLVVRAVAAAVVPAVSDPLTLLCPIPTHSLKDTKAIARL